MARVIFRRFACEGLAQNAYVLADSGEAVVVDPRRDVDDVLAFVRQHGLRVTRVLATHVHADFVAGLLEVAAATGATVALGERFTGRLPCTRLAHGERVRVGGVDVEVLATPGHTLESVSFLAAGDAAGERPARLLTGDALFVGDVGRPDLAQGAGHSPHQMAELLFATLRERFARLAPETEVWPAHGAGSACGSRIAAAASSTLAVERATNWALREPDEGRFVRRLLESVTPPPRHFPRLAALNHDGAPLLATLPAVPQLDVAAAKAAATRGARLVDVRQWPDHARAHWPGAINLGLRGGDFEPWAGALLAPDVPIVLHAANDADAREAITRLRRVGLDDVRGFVLELPADATRTRELDALDLFVPNGTSPLQVLDVRRADEYAAGHVPGAIHAELGPDLDVQGLDRAHPTAVLCDAGYRSSAAVALLRARGFTNLHNVRDGMHGWRSNHLPLARDAGVAGGSPTATS
jgi:hydroxyacylglutathione hydrolase